MTSMLTNTALSSEHLIELELKSEDTHTHKTHPRLHPERIQTALRESNFLLGQDFNAFQLKFERLQVQKAEMMTSSMKLAVPSTPHWENTVGKDQRSCRIFHPIILRQCSQ